MWDDTQDLKIVLGREGFFGLRQRDRIALGGLVTLRNATLEDNTLRTVGGASKFGIPVTGAPHVLGCHDYWEDPITQRNVVMGSDGKLWEDDGAAGAWADVTGALGALTVTGAVPHFSDGGKETTGLSRALFYADGVNAQRVRRGSGAFAALTNPAPEWAGTNRPRGFFINQQYNWAFGNPSFPHHLIRSLDTNHENFTATPFAAPIFPGQGLYISCCLDFKGLIIVWKFPEGVYAYDTRDADSSKWYAVKVGSGGCPSPTGAEVVENDVIWVDLTGGLHLLSAVQETGSVKAEDLSYKKLSRYIPDKISRPMLTRCQLRYNPDRQKVVLACAAQGSTTLNRRLTLDYNNKAEVGERWIIEDRDVNESLFMRRDAADNVLKPIMGDDVGQLWKLDTDARTKDGAGYTFEWWTADSDFSQLAPTFMGKSINGAYIQLVYDPRGSVDHTIRVWRDGTMRQSIPFTLSGGDNTLPFVFPIVFGASTMMATRKRRLLGSARRWAFQGLSSATGADVSIAGLILGLHVGRE
jgi:hypothetical protein